MRPELRILRLELTELAPLLGLAYGVVVMVGADGATAPFVTHNAQLTLLWLAGSLGLVQGLLDRRFRGNSFLKHRPVRSAGLQGARAVGGALAIVGLAAVFLIVRWNVRRSLDPEQVGQLRAYWGMWGGDEYSFLWWPIWRGQLAEMFLAWTAVRFAVGTAGLVSAIVLAPLLYFWVLSALSPSTSSWGWGSGAIAAGFVVVLAIYQGVRLASVEARV